MDKNDLPTLPLRIRVRVPKLDDEGTEDTTAQRTQPLRPVVRPKKESDLPKEAGEGEQK